MGHLGREARKAMAVLLDRGHTKSDVARLLGVSEGTVRCYDCRMREGAVDGRSRQQGVAAGYAASIAHWRDLCGSGAVNLAALHAWLVREHGYGAACVRCSATGSGRIRRRRSVRVVGWRPRLGRRCRWARSEWTWWRFTWCCRGAARKRWCGPGTRTCCRGCTATRPVSSPWAVYRRRYGSTTRRRR